ncbi:MAG: hypothetical protein ACSHX6_10280 [Akkermansiaceae bacterium]
MFNKCHFIKPFISLSLILTSIGSISCTGIQGNIKAPASTAKAINQNTVHRNGCGISSLINAYRFGSPKWQSATNKIAGTTDKEQFNFIANNYGNVASKYSPGTRRWENSTGISSIDLKDLANDFQNRQNLSLPNLKLTTHYVQANEPHTALLKRTHRQLKSSLRSGFPAILSIKHLAGSKVEGHIVVLYEIPASIPSSATSFPIKYVDPLGGIVKSGLIRVPGNSFSSVDFSTGSLKLIKARTLSMDLPQSDIAKRYRSTGDNIVLSASIAP